VLALAVSGSREAVVTVTVVLAAAVLICLMLGSRFKKALVVIVLAYLAFIALGTLPVFHEGLDVMKGRFTSGGGVHEGIVRRYFGDLMGVFDAAGAAPLLGFGIGVGTNVGASLATGQRAFMLAEGEWARVVLEGGVVAGFAFILLRIALLLHIARTAFRALERGNTLPLLLLGASFFNVLAGKYGQPTECGFAMLVAGLALAAANETGTKPGAVFPRTAPRVEPPPGRASYAETLHEEGGA
jgi:hypothetical protein